ISFTQACYMRKAMRVDQRAWVSVPIPAIFRLDSPIAPVNVQITDSGKTPARGAHGTFIATVMKKGEIPAIGNFTLGHAYNKFEAGAVYPGSPLPMNIPLLDYVTTVEKGQQIIPVDDKLRQEIKDGNKFILFFGRINYI